VSRTTVGDPCDTSAQPRNGKLQDVLDLIDASREQDRRESEERARRLEAIERELSDIPDIKRRLGELEKRVASAGGEEDARFDPTSLGNNPRLDNASVRWD
jgi:hypothetical protein